MIWSGIMCVPALGISVQYSGCYQGSRGSCFFLKYFTNSPITDDSKQTAFLPTCQRFLCAPPRYFYKSVTHHTALLFLSYSGVKNKNNPASQLSFPSFFYLWDLITKPASCCLGNLLNQGSSQAQHLALSGCIGF